MIKYLGSKRVLAPVLAQIAVAVEARTALDLFTGTTRVAQAFKAEGIYVTAADIATYAEILAGCYIATDAGRINQVEVDAALAEMSALAPTPGYFTATFCEQSRYVHPRNGARIDAMREYLEREHRGGSLYPILLTALLLAADRVDSTTGLQMAYLKTWAPRALREIELRAPQLLAGPGRAVIGDAATLVDELDPVDLAYLDPPYNQHRYFSNYHVWETLVRWDQPEVYGIACKRIDAQDASTKSAFNRKREMPLVLESVIRRVRAETVVVSYNDESWVARDQIAGWLAELHETVAILAFDSRRYVGARIGIYNPAGEKVGKISHLRNTEYVFVAGPHARVQAAQEAVEHHAMAGNK